MCHCQKQAPIQKTNPASWLNPKRLHRGLILILLAYLIAATRFAVGIPRWLAPDEPAHYNYIVHIAAAKRLPVLKMGDYNQSYLELYTSSSFPNDLSIEPLRYEFHQPPLYYYTAVWVFSLTGGDFRALRFYGVMLGAGVIAMTFLCARTILPNRPFVALGAASFVAFLPMHIGMMSAINNDGLAELLIASSMLLLVRWMRVVFHPDKVGGLSKVRENCHLLLLGVLVGLGLLTKATAYVLLPLSIGTVGIITWITQPSKSREKRLSLLVRSLMRCAGMMLLVLVPACLIGLPWWWRNMSVYGYGDFLGLARHAQVVAEQPRTVDWIVHYGWAAYWNRTWSFTFNSFWGVFGWMGIFLDDRIYMALLFFSVAVLVGFLWVLANMVSRCRNEGLNSFQYWTLKTLFLLLLGVVAGYIWYNLEFVQHQGRYLFPGLIALSIFVALGWSECLEPVVCTAIAGLAIALLVYLGLIKYLGNVPDKWLFLYSGAMLASFGGLSLLSRCSARAKHSGLVTQLLTLLRFIVWSGPFLLIFILDLHIPFVVSNAGH